MLQSETERGARAMRSVGVTQGQWERAEAAFESAFALGIGKPKTPALNAWKSGAGGPCTTRPCSQGSGSRPSVILTNFLRLPRGVLQRSARRFLSDVGFVTAIDVSLASTLGLGDCEAIDLNDRSIADIEPATSGSGLTLSDEATPWAWDAWFESLVLAAWGMLQENLDAVEWALCRAGFQRSKIRCVLDQISGASPPVPVKNNRECDAKGLFGFALNGEIGLCVGTYEMDYSKDMWCGDYWPDGASICALIFVSSILMHEIMHVCGLATGGEGEPKFIAANNNYRWVMQERYPGAEECCEPYELDSTVKSGMTVLCEPGGPSGDPDPPPGLPRPPIFISDDEIVEWDTDNWTYILDGVELLPRG